MDEPRNIVVTIAGLQVHGRIRDLLGTKREPCSFHRGVDSGTFVGVIMNF